MGAGRKSIFGFLVLVGGRGGMDKEDPFEVDVEGVE